MYYTRIYKYCLWVRQANNNKPRDTIRIYTDLLVAHTTL